MKTIFKSLIIATALFFMLIADVPFMLEHGIPIPFKQNVQAVLEELVPDADAILGVRRRTRRRTAVVAYSAGAAAGAVSASEAAASQQAAAAQQQTSTTQQQGTAAQQAPPAAPPAAPSAPSGKPLPIGTVVTALPAGCTTTPVGGIEYYYCGGNFYRSAFQGNQLVYVTAQPK